MCLPRTLNLPRVDYIISKYVGTGHCSPSGVIQERITVEVSEESHRKHRASMLGV